MFCTAAVRKNREVAIVDLAGRFTVGTATGVIRKAVADLLKAGERNIVLNLAEVTYMDSAAGVGELVASYTSTCNVGGRLKLLRPGQRVENVLHIVRLDQVFETYADEEDAVRSFSQEASPA
jgi:anti-sigma B factor antagonist